MENQCIKGGIYLLIDVDKQDKWYIKESSTKDIIVEFIASKLYGYFLDEYSSASYIITDTANDRSLIGSKFIKDFSPIQDFANNNLQNINHIIIAFHYGCIVENENLTYSEQEFVTTSIYGKSIEGFEKLWLVSRYLQDIDVRLANMGIITEEESFHFCKIDHDNALLNLREPISISIIKEGLNKANLIGWQLETARTIEAIENITNTPFIIINSIIEQSIIDLRQYFTDEEVGLAFEELEDDEISIDNTIFTVKNFEELEQYLKIGLSLRQFSFANILTGLKIDQAIDNNISEIGIIQNYDLIF